MERAARSMIISDGGTAALLACVSAREALASLDPTVCRASDVRPLVWCTAPSVALGEWCSDAVRRQAELLELEIASPAPGVMVDGRSETRVLFEAAYEAAERGCDRVVWPVHFPQPLADADSLGLDLDRIATAVDRGLLVSRLVAIAASHACPTCGSTAVRRSDRRQIADPVMEFQRR